jgi:chitinase
MRRNRVATLAAAVTLATGLGGSLATPAQAAPPLPAHVFAPYFEGFKGDSLAGLSRQSGDKDLVLAFAQTDTVGSCRADWNGKLPLSQASFGADIRAIRARGGDVIASYGGYDADHGGLELADSCTSVDAIAADYERMIKTYGFTRLDLDVEDISLNNAAGIDRRNKAIKKVEDWAYATHRVVQFQYTLPVEPEGLEFNGLAVIQNAAANKARIDVVNIMTFDYYDEDPATGVTGHEMADATKTAAEGLVSQLKAVWPGRTDAQYWRTVGITEMIGEDDYANDSGDLAAENFTLADAAAVTGWARRKGIGFLSFWAVQRDNNGCPDQAPAGVDCSGDEQTPWEYSQVMRHFATPR